MPNQQKNQRISLNKMLIEDIPNSSNTIEPLYVPVRSAKKLQEMAEEANEAYERRKKEIDAQYPSLRNY